MCGVGLVRAKLFSMAELFAWPRSSRRRTDFVHRGKKEPVTDGVAAMFQSPAQRQVAPVVVAVGLAVVVAVAVARAAVARDARTSGCRSFAEGLSHSIRLYY